MAIETHFSYTEHELSSHFSQFNNRGLEVLFNPLHGFKIIDSGLFNPIVGVFQISVQVTLEVRMFLIYIAIHQFLQKNKRAHSSFQLG